MPGSHFGLSLENIEVLGQLKYMDTIGSDPYWAYKPGKRLDWDEAGVYEYVYQNATKNMEACRQTGKDHTIWVKAYGIPAGYERDTVYAAEAAYDAGARNIFFWGFRGCDGNEYRSHNPEMHWAAVGDATARLWDRERARVVAEARKNLGLE